MIVGIDHIGIAVKDIEQSKTVFDILLGTHAQPTEEIVDSEQVKTRFYSVGKTKIELIEDLTTNGTISKYLEKNREGIHHIAIEVENIEKAIQEYKSKHIRVLIEPPKQGANNKKITFLHPKDTAGVLIELCQHTSK